MNLTWEIFFLENHTQNLMEELVPGPFMKIKTEHMSGQSVWNVIKFVFIICPSRVLPKYITAKVLTTGFYLICKAYKPLYISLYIKSIF